MSNESEIIKMGAANPILYNHRRKQQRFMEQEMDLDDTAFRQEQALKKEKIGDATAMVITKAEELASAGTPMTKKELANACIAALSQANFEMADDMGKMVARPNETGSSFSLPEYGYYMDLVEMATEGVPIAAKAGQVTTNGVKPMTAERFRNIFEQALKKLRGTVDSNPELKEVLPQYLKESKQKPSLGFSKFKTFENISQYISRHTR
jgi:hypothetical protein